MPEALTHERPPLSAIDDTSTSRCRRQSAAPSAPKTTLLQPGPWTSIRGSPRQGATVPASPKSTERPQRSRTSLAAAWSPG